MSPINTFYLSRIIGSKVVSEHVKQLGKLQDLAVDLNFERPKVIAAKVKILATSP